MKKILLVGLTAAATMFASCNKEDGRATGNGKDKKTVILSIEHEQAPSGTRAATDKVTDHNLTLQEGYIFFVENGGTIVRYLKMINGSASNDNEFDLGDISANKAVIEDVLTSANKCYIFANIPAATQTALTALNLTEGLTKISAVMALDMGINDLVDNTNWGVANMPQFGEGTVNQPVSDGDPMTATVQVYAMGSRIQIQQLTGHTDIKDFKLNGIFINRYFEKMKPTYALAYSDMSNNGSVVANYTHNVGSPYLTLNISDYDNTGALGVITPQATTVEAVPDNGEEVWAYNLWPTEGVPTADQENAFPQVIFVLSDVEYDNGVTNESVAGPLYLTVKGMKESLSGQLIEATKKGNSYTFSNVTFEFSDLTTVPEVDAINAEVTIQMIGWKDNDVEQVL